MRHNNPLLVSETKGIILSRKQFDLFIWMRKVGASLPPKELTYVSYREPTAPSGDHFQSLLYENLLI